MRAREPYARILAADIVALMLRWCVPRTSSTEHDVQNVYRIE